MMEANVISAAEEAELLKEWFETVHWDEESEGIPELQPENDDEESRAIRHAYVLAEWLSRDNPGEPPIVDSAAWDYIDFDELGMKEETARFLYENELSFSLLFMRGNPYHSKKDGKFAKAPGGGSSATPKDLSSGSLPPTEKPNVVEPFPKSVKDPISGSFFSENTGSPWQQSDDLNKRAGGVWSEYHDGMAQTRQIVSNRKHGRPDMENVDPEKGWLTNYQRVGEVQYGNNGPRLGEVIQKGNKYSKEDMGVDLRNAATVLQHKMDVAPIHKTPLYRGMLMKGKDIPKAGDTFDTDISSWATHRDSAAVFAYAREVPSMGIVGDHAVIMRMVGSKKTAFIGDDVASGIMDDEHIASGKFRINRVTKKGKSVNIEVEQIL